MLIQSFKPELLMIFIKDLAQSKNKRINSDSHQSWFIYLLKTFISLLKELKVAYNAIKDIKYLKATK